MGWRGELKVKIAHRDQPAVDLVDLLENLTGRSLHLQHLPGAATKGVVTSRLVKAVPGPSNNTYRKS
jgi:hypothetical protein